MSSTTMTMLLLRLAVKDIRIGRKYLMAIIPLYLAYGAMFYLTSKAFFFVNGIFISVIVIGLTLLDARNNADLLFCSLPMSRPAVVVGRYLGGLVVVVAGAIFCFSYGYLLYLIKSPFLCIVY